MSGVEDHAVARMDFSVAGAVQDRLERLLTKAGRKRAGDLPEWADEIMADSGGFRDVIDALAFADEIKFRPPLAAVLPLGEVAGENRAGRAGAVQRVTATIAVAVMIAAPNDPGGRRARYRRELSMLLAASRAALIGWTPVPEGGADIPGRPEPLIFERGALAEIEDGRIVWQDLYRCDYWIAGGASLTKPVAKGRTRQLMEGH